MNVLTPSTPVTTGNHPLTSFRGLRIKHDSKLLESSFRAAIWFQPFACTGCGYKSEKAYFRRPYVL